ncbi:MAG: SDR family oxidoreductase [Betaproteobacteria bacterium]|nr:SDR family oxidoreductase [Betaproteobacteria bacterium]
MQLKGKTALVAGASRNIGKAIALTFAREGADLILVANKSGDELQQVTNECEAFGVQALPLQADVGNHEEVDRMVELGMRRFGKVDTLVSVAAIRPHKYFREISYDEWHQVFAVNLHSTFYLAKALAPTMMQRKSGNIIALGGLSALTAQPLQALVAATKHGLYGLIKSLALELGPYGIRANLIAVGLIDTERRNPEWYPEAAGGRPESETSAWRVEQTVLGRKGTPQDVANVALFLASDQSSYVTGDRIVCAGGKYM